MNHDTCRDILRTALLGGALDPTNAVRSALAEMGGMPIALNALASTMGCKIRVRYGASQLGETDGKNIDLMNLPIPTDACDIDSLVLMISLAYGLGYHELGHVAESDFKALKKLDAMIKKGQATPLVESLFRIVEDVRMENAFISKWPNTRKYLDSLTQSLYLTDFYTRVPANAAPMSALTGYLLYRLYHDYRGDVGTLELAREAREVCLKLFSKGFMTRLDALLPQMDNLADTSDSMTMAQNLAKFIEQEKEKEEQEQAKKGSASASQSQDGQGGQGDQTGPHGDQGNPQDSQGNQDGQQAGQDSSGDQQGGKGDQDGPQDGQDGQQSTQGNQGEPQDGQGTQGGQQDAQGGQGNQHLQSLRSILDPSNSDPRVGERADAIRQALGQAVNQVAPDSNGTLEIDNQGATKEILGTAFTSNPSPNPHCDLGSALGVSGPLRRSFKRQMEALTEVEVSVNRRGRKLSASHLHRVAGGDNRVFRSVSQEIDMDTSVVIGLDSSGSMSGDPVKLTCEAAYASAVALEGIEGVSCGAFTFPGNMLLLPFGRKAKQNPDNFRIFAGGGTPMEEGVYLGTRMLLSRRTARRVMVLVTDGQPASIPATKIAAIHALEQGIELYVIGIGDAQNVCNFSNWMYLTDIQELPGLVTQLFSRKYQRAA